MKKNLPKICHTNIICYTSVVLGGYFMSYLRLITLRDSRPVDLNGVSLRIHEAVLQIIST